MDTERRRPFCWGGGDEEDEASSDSGGDDGGLTMSMLLLLLSMTECIPRQRREGVLEEWNCEPRQANVRRIGWSKQRARGSHHKEGAI